MVSNMLKILRLNDGPSIIKYKTSWDQHHCEVPGITSTYTVFPHLDVASIAVSGYCTCRSFACAVLVSESRLV
ncbi:uncharacterized protein HD556DRAFT_107948 [Suillus plorans]|uniref:Uncharacterized protein n=1 Tax=Suillus plorans TaxID=116603 RepID=A0A9P7ACA9_9AGAM|nr:uncharacterized protein HD556DRAFT_107948 [Suillus plorans]KAG1785532.1 hypothetical protein HD556DRAFT_107948 [Suillus plorans]